LKERKRNRNFHPGKRPRFKSHTMEGRITKTSLGTRRGHKRTRTKCPNTGNWSSWISDHPTRLASAQTVRAKKNAFLSKKESALEIEEVSKQRNLGEGGKTQEIDDHGSARHSTMHQTQTRKTRLHKGKVGNRNSGESRNPQKIRAP